MSKQKYIETPEKMWQYFEEYRTHIKAKPIQMAEQKRGGAIVLPKGMHPDQFADFKEILDPIVKIPKERPLTLEGFYNWLEDSDIIVNADHYFSNRHKAYDNYVAVCARIRRVIRQDQIEGGLCGIYNPSITQRLNGLVEKSEVIQVKEQPLFDLGNEEKKPDE